MSVANENLLNRSLTGYCIIPSVPDAPANTCLPIPCCGGDKHPPSTSTCQIEEELIELLHQQMADLSRYAATVVRDHALIQDGIQEVLLRYFIARVDGQQMNNPRAWLFRVLRNYLIDCNRKTAFVPAIGMKEATHIADSRQDVETGYQYTESCSRALSLLSPREQECVRLRLEGFGYDEIAHILGIQPGTVASLLSRSLKRLRHNRKTLDK